jgi:TolB protein
MRTPLSPRPHLFLALVLAAAPGWGQEPPGPAVQTPPAEGEPAAPPPSDVVVELAPGQARLLRLAFPAIERPEPLVGAAREAADLLEATLRSDLEETRIFEIQGPWSFTALELTGERGRDFELYRSLGNELVLQAVVFREGDRLVFEGALYNLNDAKAILGKRYRGGFELARNMAHTFADEILSYLTGRRGIARTTLAFASDRDQPGRKEIYLMDYDGANQRRLTAHRSTSMSPAWSADGVGLAYTSFFSGTPGIYFAEAASGRKSPILTQGRFNVSPSLSPDGRKVAFARSLEGNIEIFVADRNGTNLRQLSHSSAIDTNPAWSPKANEIAFTSSRAGSPQIFAMDPEGANLRRLTYEGTFNDNAAWSPDGTKLAYSSRRDSQFQIAVTDVVTLETRLLTSGSGSHEDPTFSPDGGRIAFALKRGGSVQIWVMDAETGANSRQLTKTGNNDSPNWSPYPP